MNYEITFFCVCDKGNVRHNNQDNFICDKVYMEYENNKIDLPLTGVVDNTSPSLFSVFDGMGGEECGEIASWIAAKTASEFMLSKKGVKDVIDYCKQANEKICQYTKENKISSMGTTMAMLRFGRKEITLCNVGDSKVFRYSQDEIEQISMDHVIETSCSRNPPLSQNLGIPSDIMLIAPYISQGQYADGDKYLICSDGLTDMVSIDDIKQVLREENGMDVINKLYERALINGGRDNVTIIFVEIKKRKKKLIQILNKRRWRNGK